MVHDVAFFADRFLNNHALVDKQVLLDLNGYRIALLSNSAGLLEKLENYFHHVTSTGNADIEVVCIESEVNDADGIEFIDWKREPGKSGRKDAYFDLTDGRLVQKVRTGMLFLQSRVHRIAIGPCLENDNQVINFINAQYMNWLQQRDHLICHASGLVFKQQCLAIAGFSGGGKSTLMLHMLAKPGVSYLTNDRLFLSRRDEAVIATGIPKLPRVNPGTLLNDPMLKPIISAERCQSLEALTLEELWHLEEKYDVDVQAIYGSNKIIPQQRISAFLILNWKFNADEPCHIQQVELSQRHDLLAAVMKSPGPFYQFKDGRFFMDNMELDKRHYLDMMNAIRIYEATGKVDFEYATEYCLSMLEALCVNC